MNTIYVIWLLVLLGVLLYAYYLLFRKLCQVMRENNELKKQLRKQQRDAWQKEPHTVNDMFLI